MLKTISICFALLILILSALATPQVSTAAPALPRADTQQSKTTAANKTKSDFVTHVNLSGIVLNATTQQVRVAVNDVPEKARVTGIDFKLAVNHAQNPNLDVRLSSPNQTTVALHLASSVERKSASSAESFGQLRSSETMHDFDGTVLRGDWALALNAVDSALFGKTADVSLAIHYKNAAKLPVVGDENAQPAIHALPQGSAAEPNSDAFGAESTTTTLMSQTFEGAFPTTGWKLLDVQPDSNDYQWGATTFQFAAGVKSAWPAAGGINKLDAAAHNYPNNMNSWMMYGPFDLGSATDAQVSFKLRYQIEPTHDYAFYGVSTDGVTFYGYEWSGSSDWKTVTSSLQSYVGQKNVWVIWEFASDSATTDQGPFIDNVVLTKTSSGCGSAASAPSTSAMREPSANDAMPHVTRGDTGKAGTLQLTDASALPTAPIAKNTSGAESATAWDLVTSQGFETTFPSNGWSRKGLNSTGCEYFWDVDNTYAAAGTQSVWLAKGGANGYSPAGATYPSSADSWMIFGPFDLSTVSAAETLFSMKRDIEPTNDYLFFGVSTDGTNFDGTRWDGTMDWQQVTMDLSAYFGQKQVWVAWVFHSNNADERQGAWLDNIKVRTQTATPSNNCTQALANLDQQLKGKSMANPMAGLPSAMPPSPQLLERVKRGETRLPSFITSESARRAAGIDQPLKPASAVSGTWHALGLLIQFSDKPGQVGAAYYDSLLFGNTHSTLSDYYRTVSYGKLDIVAVTLPSAIGWCTAPQSHNYYGAGAYGMGSYPQNAQKLAEEAVFAADPVVDFSQYDNNHDGDVDAIFVIHSGQGAEMTNNTNDIWSHSWQMSNLPLVDGVRAVGYTTEPEYWQTPGDMTIGVFAHELGHAFGLPDLYDTDYSSSGVGSWSLMSFGAWNGTGAGGNEPAFMDAWSRAQLGWVAPTPLTTDRTQLSVPPAETSQTVYRMNLDSTGKEYLLVENRQKTGYDSYLPAAGMLIWHVDDNKPNNDQECEKTSLWLCGSSHYAVSLMQADGRLDLEKNANGGDISDPFRSGSFTFSSNPNSSSYYSSADTRVAVQNISGSVANVTADFLVNGSSAMSAPTLLSPGNERRIKMTRRNLKWSDAAAPNGYMIEIRDGSPDGQQIVSTTTDNLKFRRPELTKGNWYAWRVAACDSTGCNTWSDWWMFKLK